MRTTRKSRRMRAVRKRSPRTLVEGAILTVSLLIVVGLIGYIIYHLFTYEQRSPTIVIEPNLSSVRKVDYVFYLPISVQNRGSTVIKSLWLRISLLSHQALMESVEVTIGRLPAGGKQEKVVVFQNDPRKSTLSYQASFGVP